MMVGNKQRRLKSGVLVVICCLFLAGCGRGNKGAGAGDQYVISDSGSDTMVNLAQMWAEAYREVAPNVSVEVAGGGSGVGIRDLTQGIISIANSSRDMEDSERAQAVRATGKEPVKQVVGYDALAVYVHKDNPVDTLSIEDLAGIYGENGRIERWSQLGIDMKATGASDEIVVVSRQNSSGTYAYFREKVLHKNDFKLGSLDMSGSKDVVELVKRTKGAIGYSGMGYACEGVKAVKIAVRKGEQGYAPSIENARAGKYLLSRSLMMFTLGQPEGQTKSYIDWVLSPTGQDIVKSAGYVPVDVIGNESTK